MSDVKGLIFDINENEIMSHIEDGTLSQFLKSWRNTQLIKLAKEPQVQPIVRTPEEVAEILNKIDCSDCDKYSSHCHFNEITCKKHWIEWLTKKEV